MPGATEAGFFVRTDPGRSLTSRTLDFWLLGGASLLGWAFYMLFQGLALEPVDLLFTRLGAAGLSLQLVVNYPHFMASYRLAYGRGAGFARASWFQLVAVPLGLLVAIAYAWSCFREPGLVADAFASLGSGLQAVGCQTFLGRSHQGGREVLAAMALLMSVIVGWHYSKQVFGCMVVYANFDGYPLEPWQRRGMRWGLHTIWAAYLLDQDLPVADQGMYGIPVPSLGLPPALDTLPILLWMGAVVWFYLRVVRHNQRVHGRSPSANFLVPALAFSVWWVPWLVNYQYQLVFVPFFHSLQYLPFVYKVERGAYRAATARPPEVQSALVAGGLIMAGFAAFLLVPGVLDEWLATEVRFEGSFFLFAAHVFVNVHHYFLDSVIWRFRSPEVREYLLA